MSASVQAAQQQAQTATPPTKQAQGQRPSLQPPLSPSSREREKERITLLLVINNDLLQEVLRLQAEGKAGLPGQPAGQPQAVKGEVKDEKDGVDGDQPKAKKPPHPEFIE